VTSPGNETDKDVVEPEKTATKQSMSMHDGIPVWYDCCSCEAEPYWVAAMEDDSPDKKKP
jgi:hypothetical protein